MATDARAVVCGDRLGRAKKTAPEAGKWPKIRLILREAGHAAERQRRRRSIPVCPARGWLAILACLLGPTVAGRAAETPAAPPPATAAVAPASDMSSAGWLERIAMKLESEAMSDVSMLPDTPAALVREWRSFDRNGSALGALINLGWIVLAAAYRARRSAGGCPGAQLCACAVPCDRGPVDRRRLASCMLLVCDRLGVAVFGAVFVYSRHWLLALGVTINYRAASPPMC